ncbi:MAG: hypothetical protein P1U83_06285 [Roseovarius sp.]|nr:hypothetical protein [Roseovarius sp.]
MTEPKHRLTRHNGKWHIMARKGAEGAAGAVWLSVGGCPCQITAMRVFLACLRQDKH